MKAFHSGRCGPFPDGEPFASGMCKSCWNKQFNPLYAGFYGDPPPGEEAAPGGLNPPCAARGEYTGEKRPCESCGGRTLVHLRACGVFGRCTDATRVEGVACCRGCPDRRPPGGPPLHLGAPAVPGLGWPELTASAPGEWAGTVGPVRVTASRRAGAWRLTASGHRATSGSPPLEVAATEASEDPLTGVFRVPLAWFVPAPWTGAEGEWCVAVLIE